MIDKSSEWVRFDPTVTGGLRIYSENIGATDELEAGVRAGAFLLTLMIITLHTGKYGSHNLAVTLPV